MQLGLPLSLWVVAALQLPTEAQKPVMVPGMEHGGMELLLAQHHQSW